MAAEFCEVSGREGNRKEEFTRRSTTGTDQKSCMTVAERLRLYRERQETIQRRGIETLKEMDARAEEYRRKQERERRRSMKEARTREEEQRASVEERRRKLLDEEHERRLLKLQKIWESNRRTEEVRRRRRQKTTNRMSFGSGAMSDGTLSSGGRTPTRPYRPHSIAGQVPNYALPTIASKIRAARWTDVGLDGQIVTVCYRCRSASPSIRKRSKSAEPAPRTTHHPLFRTIFSDHPVTRESSAFVFRPFPGGWSRPRSSSGSYFPPNPTTSIPKVSHKMTSSAPHNLAELEDVPETKGRTGNGQDEDEVDAKLKSSFPPSANRKLRVPWSRRHHQPTSEFRLFSFRHLDGTASMTVARGLKTPSKSKLETFQQLKKVKPGQGETSTRKNERGPCKGETGATLCSKTAVIRPPQAAAKKQDKAVVAMDTSNVTIETDLDTLETRQIVRNRRRGNSASDAEEILKMTMSLEEDSRPIAISKDRLIKEYTFVPLKHGDSAIPEKLEATGNGKVWTEELEAVGSEATWSEDTANSETISDGTSLEQFLEDSTSLSENTEDLEGPRKSADGRDIPRYFPVSMLLRKRDNQEDEGEEEETVEIYEELQIFEEIEIQRKDAKELTLILEKIVTEETLEFLCPSPDDGTTSVLVETGRGSVSSI